MEVCHEALFQAAHGFYRKTQRVKPYVTGLGQAGNDEFLWGKASSMRYGQNP